MQLDVNSPAGQVTVAQEAKMLSALRNHFSNSEFIHTNKNSPAKIDGVLMKQKNITAIFESKCRNMTRDKLESSFNNQWLITYEKISVAAGIAKALHVPFYGFLYLIPDELIAILKITDKTGTFLPRITICTTTTQATVNGGIANRSNAYIDMEEATYILA